MDLQCPLMMPQCLVELAGAQEQVSEITYCIGAAQGALGQFVTLERLLEGAPGLVPVSLIQLQIAHRQQYVGLAAAVTDSAEQAHGNVASFRCRLVVGQA